MFIDKPRSTTSYAKKQRSVTGRAGRYGLGMFGQARFGISDGFVRKARPDLRTSARADIALANFAQADSVVGYILIKRPIL